MEKTLFKKIFSVSITLVLIAAIALFGSACGKTEKANESNAQQVEDVSANVTELGEGKTQFSLTVENDGKTNSYLVKTDKTTIGDALEELGFIKGSDGMVDTVDGVKLDYNKDKKYWAFYTDGNYANKGVYETEIKAGVKYVLKAENG